MELENQLRELTRAISPTGTQQKNLQDAHIRLRERLMADADLKPLIVGTFLQGSYRRHTGIRPQGNDKPDVDIVVVTRLDRHEYTPEQALNVLRPFLNRHYGGKWKKKGRSIGIEMSKIKMDVVLTSAPSEAEESLLLNFMSQDDAGSGSSNTDNAWKDAPLWIPDREARVWQRTHPLEQIRWTQEKNQLTNGHYIHVVKLVKWWWQARHPEQKHPRSYPLEHVVGDCCPNGVTTLAEAFTKTMMEIARRYETHTALNSIPILSDRGVPEQNVLARLEPPDFERFCRKAIAAAEVARNAIASTGESESANLWKQVFGDRYPVLPSQQGFSPRSQPSRIKDGRFG